MWCLKRWSGAHFDKTWTDRTSLRGQKEAGDWMMWEKSTEWECFLMLTLKNSSYYIIIYMIVHWLSWCWTTDPPPTGFISFCGIEQRYITLTATRGFEKLNLTTHVNMLHGTAILAKSGHILQRKSRLVFPLTSYDCSASTLWFTEVPESNM